MSDIIPVEGGLTPDELAAMLGAADAPKSVRIPALKINSQGEDKDGNQIPLGAFFLNTEEERVYAKDGVVLHALSNHIQYMHWDDGRLVNKSRLIIDKRDEARDQLGGTMCGMPSYEQSIQMTPEQRKEYEGRDRYRVIRGLVSYTGKTASGEERTIENEPVIMSLKRKNYGPFYHDVIKRIPSDGKFFNYRLALTADKQTTDKGAKYYIMRFSPDLQNKVTLDQKLYDSMNAVAGMVKAENERIDKSYFDAIARKADEVEQDRIMEEVNTLEHDF